MNKLHKIYSIFFLLIISLSYVNAEFMINKSDTTTQFDIHQITKNLVDQLLDNYTEKMEHTDLFVLDITNADMKMQNHNNKFNFVFSNALKSELQKRTEFNVYELESLSSKKIKRLMKKYGVKYILKGTYSELLDGIYMNIKILSLEDSKMLSSANIHLKKMFHTKIMNMRYKTKDNDGNYYMKLKSSK